MKLTILIATMNENLASLKEKLLRLPAHIDVVICHQITKEQDDFEGAKNEIEAIREGISVIQKRERGLSKSRNVALSAVKSGVCLITDDDVEFDEHLYEQIKEAYKAYPDADVITFQAKTPEGEFFKSYKNESFVHTMKSAAKVSSIEISFKAESIGKSGVFFDERFGLGSLYATGEEYIFLTDALKIGLTLRYYPKAIAIHPKESSGSVFDEKMFIAKGAMFARVFGAKAYTVSLLFALKKYPKYKHNLGLTRAFLRMREGVRAIMASVKSRS